MQQVEGRLRCSLSPQLSGIARAVGLKGCPWCRVGECVRLAARDEHAMGISLYVLPGGWLLSPVGLLKQNITDWVAYKQQKFLSHSSGGRESSYQGASMARWGSSSRLLVMVVTAQGIRGQGTLWDSFIYFRRAPLSPPNHLPKAAPPNTITFGG